MERSEAAELNHGDSVVLDGERQCVVREMVDGGHSVLVSFGEEHKHKLQWVHCGRLSR